MWPFKRKTAEGTRSSGSGFTAEIMSARESYISGQRGIAELTATAQGAVTLWEGGLGLADVSGTNATGPAVLGALRAVSGPAGRGAIPDP